MRLKHTAISGICCIVLSVSSAGCGAASPHDPEEVAAVLKSITGECSLAPYFLEMNDSGKVILMVPPNVRAMPLNEEKTKCAEGLVLERLDIRMAS